MKTPSLSDYNNAKEVIELYEERTLLHKKNLRNILNTVCLIQDVNVNTVISTTRNEEIVKARDLYCIVACAITKSTLTQIGAEIGNRDHATVIHARGKAYKYITEASIIIDKIKL